MIRHTVIAIAGLACTAAPALAQHEQHGQQAAGHADMMTHMVCEMGMLPSFGMGGGMGMMGQGQAMQHGQMGQGQAMQHGQMGQAQGQAKPDGQPAQGQAMQHGQPAQGQAMQHGKMGQGEAGMGGMMGGMDHTRTAHMLAEHGDQMGLALTDEQKARMNELAEQASAACGTHLKAAHSEHAAALAALEKGDLEEYGDKLEDAAEHAIQAHVPVIRSGVEAKALLTPQQREALKGKAGAQGQHQHE